MTRHANLAGKGHEKHVRNHCDAYSTGRAVYSCAGKPLHQRRSLSCR